MFFVLGLAKWSDRRVSLRLLVVHFFREVVFREATHSVRDVGLVQGSVLRHSGVWLVIVFFVEVVGEDQVIVLLLTQVLFAGLVVLGGSVLVHVVCILLRLSFEDGLAVQTGTSRTDGQRPIASPVKLTLSLYFATFLILFTFSIATQDFYWTFDLIWGFTRTYCSFGF